MLRTTEVVRNNPLIDRYAIQSRFSRPGTEGVILLRFDAKKVAVKTKTGMAKIPGKKCGGGYISAAFNCRSHKTGGKLNDKGKASARELATKVRSLKGITKTPAPPLPSSVSLAISNVKASDSYKQQWDKLKPATRNYAKAYEIVTEPVPSASDLKTIAKAKTKAAENGWDWKAIWNSVPKVSYRHAEFKMLRNREKLIAKEKAERDAYAARAY